MRTTTILSILMIAGTASAADFPRRPAFIEPPLVQAAPVWAGFYVGGNIGGGWANARADFSTTGPVFGTADNHLTGKGGTIWIVKDGVAKVTATGTLSAIVTVQVGSQVSGRVAALHADFNSPVKKGQLIAKIDPQLFQASLEQARANHAAAHRRPSPVYHPVFPTRLDDPHYS